MTLNLKQRGILATIATTLAMANVALAQNPGAGAVAGQQADDAQNMARVSYMIGHDLVTQYKKMGVELNAQEMIRGIQAATAGEELGLPNNEAETLAQWFQGFVKDAQSRFIRTRSENFLAENAKQAGVQVLPSGVQYRVVQEGTGATPNKLDFIRVHYTGRLVDGTEFDSSIGGEPAKFPVSGVIAGMTECLLKMKVGEKCQMVIPSQHAYGENPPPRSGIAPGDTLVFDVELISIEDNR